MTSYQIKKYYYKIENDKDCDGFIYYIYASVVKRRFGFIVDFWEEKLSSDHKCMFEVNRKRVRRQIPCVTKEEAEIKVEMLNGNI